LQVDYESINEWVDALYRVLLHLERVATSLEAAGGANEALGEINLCRANVGRVVHDLVRHGAEDPAERMMSELRDAMEESGMILPPMNREPLPLHLLASEANRRYCELLEQLLPVAHARDTERGWAPEGPAQVVADMLADARLEVYGPPGKD
jgi:hypothetical protein